MSGEEFLQNIRKEVKRIDEKFLILTWRKFTKYEKQFPEMIAKFQEHRRCTDTYERLGISLEIWKLAYQLRKWNNK